MLQLADGTVTMSVIALWGWGSLNKRPKLVSLISGCMSIHAEARC